MELQNAIELIEKSGRIALLLPQKHGLDHLCAAEVLFSTLEARGKEVGILGDHKNDIGVPPEMLKNLSSASPLPREFIVSLDTAKYPVKELRYEKGEGRVDIILSPKTRPIEKDALTVREGKTLCDLLIFLGVGNLEEESRNFRVEPDFFTHVSLLQIDNSPEADNSAEVALIDPDKSSLSEMIYELSTALLEKPLEKDAATLLLSGIYFETSGLQSPRVTPDTLLAASELSRLSGSIERARALARIEDTVGLIQLAGRASVRSRADGERGVFWSFLTAEDFEKTGRGAGDIPLVIKKLESQTLRAPAHVLLWQNPETNRVHVTLAGERKTLEAVRALEPGAYQSPYLTLAADFVSFREAEERLSLLLGKAL